MKVVINCMPNSSAVNRWGHLEHNFFVANWILVPTRELGL
jgi:hypothetical protein